jgi:hypothetical protein
LIEVGNRCPGCQTRGDLIEMASEIAEIEHVFLMLAQAKHEARGQFAPQAH